MTARRINRARIRWIDTPSRPRIVVWSIPLGPDVFARLELRGEITQRRLRKIIAYLELAMDEFDDNRG